MPDIRPHRPDASPADERESREYQAPFRISGSHNKRASTLDVREDMDSVRPVADLMMAAAHADDVVTESERQTVRGLLCQLLGTRTLPDNLEQHLADFDPVRFDLRASASAFTASSRTDRRRMLELVRKVCDADQVIDLREDNYMLGLVLALSMAPDEYADLVVGESRGINGPIKRVMDIVLSGLGLLVLAVPMLLLGACVRLTSKGPALFRQRRYGRGGHEIHVYKFRSMSVVEDGDAVQQAGVGDTRVTPLGAWMRRTSVDELPQLLNVFFGDMSLVGPRPHAVTHNRFYSRQIVEYMLRHKVRPGITGWAQVHGWRGPTETLRKMVYRVEHDLYYIQHWSLALDLRILWMTLFGRRVRQNAL